MMEGGYDCEFVCDVTDELICVVCHLALRDPVQVANCGHRFCKSCFNQLKCYSMENGTNLLCPFDRNVIDTNMVFPDKAAERSVLSLLVRCGFSTSDCLWTGELRDLMSHMEKCQMNQNSAKTNISNDVIELFEQRFRGFEKTIEERDRQIEECNNRIKILEETVRQQAVQINANEANLKSQKEQNRFMLKEIGKHSDLKSPFEWLVHGRRLKSGDLILSDSFYGPIGTLCFQMGVQYDSTSNELDVYLYRYRGLYDEPVVRIKNSVEFQYKIYVLDIHGKIESYENTSCDSEGFNIGKGYAKSNGALTGFLNPFDWDRWVRNDQMFLYCQIEPLKNEQGECKVQ